MQRLLAQNLILVIIASVPKDARGGKPVRRSTPVKECSLRFEPVGMDSMLSILDAISWLDGATQKAITQFTASDPRTVGKAIKNCRTLGIIDQFGEVITLRLPYPPKGSRAEKEGVLREALFKMPLIVRIRQFLRLGDDQSTATRKAATMVGVENYNESSVAPLLKWARELRALEWQITTEDLVDQAVSEKDARHKTDSKKVVAFLSHSSKDKAFIRQLSSDLVSEGVDVWLDEQKILIGDSITEKIGQGLAQSDYFIIALSAASTESQWVKKELSEALIREVEKRQVTILPILIGDCEIPSLLRDKKYLDFRQSYREGLRELVTRMKEVQK